MAHDPNRPTPHTTTEHDADRATDPSKEWIDADESTTNQSDNQSDDQADSSLMPNGLPPGRQVSSASSESFHAMSEMPNADYDDIGEMNRVGMPPQNNPSDTKYYETYEPDTVSNTPEPPAAQPRKMNEQAKDDATNYNQ